MSSDIHWYPSYFSPWHVFILFCLKDFLESSYPWISKILWKCQFLHIFIHQTLARPPSVKIHVILSVLKNYFLFFDFFFLFCFIWNHSVSGGHRVIPQIFLIFCLLFCSSFGEILLIFKKNFLDFYLPIFLLILSFALIFLVSLSYFSSADCPFLFIVIFK